MAKNDPSEQAAIMHDKIDKQRNAAQKQFRDFIKNSTITGSSPPIALRDLLNKLRLNLRDGELIQEAITEESA